MSLLFGDDPGVLEAHRQIDYTKNFVWYIVKGSETKLFTHVFPCILFLRLWAPKLKHKSPRAGGIGAFHTTIYISCSIYYDPYRVETTPTMSNLKWQYENWPAILSIILCNSVGTRYNFNVAALWFMSLESILRLSFTVVTVGFLVLITGNLRTHCGFTIQLMR